MRANKPPIWKEKGCQYRLTEVGQWLYQQRRRRGALQSSHQAQNLSLSMSLALFSSLTERPHSSNSSLKEFYASKLLSYTLTPTLSVSTSLLSIHQSLLPSIPPPWPPAWPACLPTVRLHITPLLCFVRVSFLATDNSRDRPPGQRAPPSAEPLNSSLPTLVWGSFSPQRRESSSRQAGQGRLNHPRVGTPRLRWRALWPPKAAALSPYGIVMR